MSDDYEGFFIEWIEQWSQFFQSCNWYTFHPVHIEIEDDRSMGGIECSVVIMGLGFRARWNHTRTEKVESIARQVAEIQRSNAND